MKAYLVPDDGSDAIELTKDLIVIGRHEGCEIALDDDSVSKTHCVLARGDGLWLLRDLGSTNGCRINGKRVARGALLNGDKLAVAAVKYRFKYEADPA